MLRGIRDKPLDLTRGFRRTLRQPAHLGCDHGETATRLSGAGGLDPGVQRQQVRLERDIVDDGDDAVDLVRGCLDLFHGLDRLSDDAAALLCDRAIGARHALGRAGQIGGGVHAGGQFGQRRRRFLQRGGLRLCATCQILGGRGDLVRARAHLAGDLDDAAHRAAQIGHDLVEAGAQRLVFMGKGIMRGAGDLRGQVASRQPLQPGRDIGHDPRLLAGLRLRLGGAGLAQGGGGVAGLLGLGQAVAELFQIAGDRADLVAHRRAGDRPVVVLAGDILHRGVDGRQGPQGTTRHHLVQRKGQQQRGGRQGHGGGQVAPQYRLDPVHRHAGIKDAVHLTLLIADRDIQRQIGMIQDRGRTGIGPPLQHGGMNRARRVQRRADRARAVRALDVGRHAHELAQFGVKPEDGRRLSGLAADIVDHGVIVEIGDLRPDDVAQGAVRPGRRREAVVVHGKIIGQDAQRHPLRALGVFQKALALRHAEHGDQHKRQGRHQAKAGQGDLLAQGQARDEGHRNLRDRDQEPTLAHKC